MLVVLTIAIYVDNRDKGEEVNKVDEGNNDAVEKDVSKWRR
jgi:hypothetical protein